MEQIFDTLQAAVQKNPYALREDSAYAPILDELIRYYENGQWLRDYESDEQGMLPVDLKRGVLSQDAIFDLLTDMK